jgi:hypothetical protein
MVVYKTVGYKIFGQSALVLQETELNPQNNLKFLIAVKLRNGRYESIFNGRSNLFRFIVFLLLCYYRRHRAKDEKRYQWCDGI